MWLDFFMYVKWFGEAKFTLLSKIFKKDATELTFAPQLGNHRTFQKMSKKKIFDQIFSIMSAISCQNLPKMAKLGMKFKIV